MLGNHRIVGVLGRGGMGVVYEAEDILLGRLTAIKVLPEALASDPKATERFLQEARAAAKLHHPNVVTIFEIGLKDGLSYLVMEKVDGWSLGDAMEAGPIPWREATDAISQACLGLSAAHRSGLIHRDIKPSNLLRTRDNAVKIADFGLARLGDDLGSLHLTRTGRVVGTPAYMSPEQCHSEPIDTRTDLYAMGASYYGLLTGRGPYADSTSAPKIMFAHCYKDPPDPREFVPDLPDGCAAIIVRAMAKAPGERYPNADAFRKDLEALLAGAGPSMSLPPTLSAVAVPRLEVPPTGTRSPERETEPAARSVGSKTHGQDIGPARWTRRAAVGLGLVGVASVFGIPAFRGSLPGRAEPLGGSGAAAGPIAETVADEGAIGTPPKGPPIRVGILHSLSGMMADSEGGVVDGTMLAIEEINAAGGVLGRPIEAVEADGRSNPETFAAEAERLISAEGVLALFGCWTSASRKAVLPVVEQHDHLLFYPVQYEGLESSPNVVYLGASPNQQLLPAVKWAFVELGRSFFHVGSDYIFPRAASAVIRDLVAKLDGRVVGEAFRPISSVDFREVVEQIKATAPAVILNTINGEGNIAFFRDLREAGITPRDIPTISFSIAEPEVLRLGLSEMTGDYASWNYFMSIDRPENRAFVERFRARYGSRRVTSDPIEAAYVGVHLWAQAAEEAGAADPSAVRSAIGGREFAGPGGLVKVDPENHHLWKVARIARLDDRGRFGVVNSSGSPIAPEPFPRSRSTEEWEALLQSLQDGWGGKWSAPS
jgi:urea transport system substrate-binding protein